MLHADRERDMLELDTEKLIGSVSVFVQHWAGDEVLSRQGGEVTHLVQVPSASYTYLCLDGKIVRDTFVMK